MDTKVADLVTRPLEPLDGAAQSELVADRCSASRNPE